LNDCKWTKTAKNQKFQKLLLLVIN